MPSKIAAPSRVVSRKALLPGRFNGSRTLFSPRENAKFLQFSPLFDHSGGPKSSPEDLRKPPRDPVGDPPGPGIVPPDKSFIFLS